NGMDVASDPAPPYEWAGVAFPSGTYSLQARAIDYAGNEALSVPVMIGVDEDPDPPDPSTSGGGESTGEGGSDTGSDTGAEGTGTGGGETGEGPGSDEDGTTTIGCACSSSGKGTPAWGGLGLLGLVAWRRRRRS